MLEIVNPIIIEKVETLEILMNYFPKKNVQRGERLHQELSLSSLFQLNPEEKFFEGIQCDSFDSHVHYLIHLDYERPMMEVLAGDPRIAYTLIENEIGLLLPKAIEKKKRLDRKNELIARGEKPKGGSKGKKGIYIQTGDGFGKTPQENFAELVDLKRVSSYFVEVAPELDFTAVRHPSRLKKKKSVSSDLAI